MTTNQRSRTFAESDCKKRADRRPAHSEGGGIKVTRIAVSPPIRVMVVTPTVSVCGLVANGHFAQRSAVTRESVERVSAPLVVVPAAEPESAHGHRALGNFAVRHARRLKSVELSLTPRVVVRIAKSLCAFWFVAFEDAARCGRGPWTFRFPVFRITATAPLLIMRAAVSAALHVFVAPSDSAKPLLLSWHPPFRESGTSRCLIMAATVSARVASVFTQINRARSFCVLRRLRHDTVTVSTAPRPVNGATYPLDSRGACVYACVCEWSRLAPRFFQSRFDITYAVRRTSLPTAPASGT